MSTTANNNANNKTQVSNKINQWLKEEKYSFVPFELPYFDFGLEIKEPRNDIIRIGMETDKKDSVIVYTRIDFDPLEGKAYSTLQTDMKHEFIYALASGLLGLNLLYHIHPDIEHLEYLDIRKYIFFDGLSKDRFFNTIDRVLSGKGLARLAYFKYLPKPKGSNSSLRSLFL
jgi:hypothetical protein